MSSGFLTTGVFYWFNWIDPIGGIVDLLQKSGGEREMEPKLLSTVETELSTATLVPGVVTKWG